MKRIWSVRKSIVLTIFAACASTSPPPASPAAPFPPEPAATQACAGLSDQVGSLCAADEILKVERMPVPARGGDTLTGARMVFRAAPGRTEASLRQAVDCQIAATSAQDPRQYSPLVSYCPVAIAGVTAVVRPVPEGFAVEVLPRNASVARKISHSVVHGSLALALGRFESSECHGVPPRERASCPLLGPVNAVLDEPQGVRVEFPEPAAVDGVLARMRCHYAFAQARGFSQEAAACPLYVRGLRLERSADGKAIDISVTPAALVGEVRRNIREEVVYAPGASGGK